MSTYNARINLRGDIILTKKSGPHTITFKVLPQLAFEYVDERDHLKKSRDALLNSLRDISVELPCACMDAARSQDEPYQCLRCQAKEAIALAEGGNQKGT